MTVTRSALNQTKHERRLGPDAGLDGPHWRKPVYSITEFCELYSIARSTLFRWGRGGVAPEIRSLGRRRFITEHARANWHRKHFGDE